MANVPQELVERIVSYADQPTRANMLTVSRSFQIAVERNVFGGRVKLESGKLEQFLTRYRGHRIRFLRGITFKVTFPVQDPHECRESPEEIQANNELFTRQITGLFNATKTLEERGAASQNPLTRISLAIEIGRQGDTHRKHCHHRRYHSWRLHLLDPSALPSLSSVRALSLQGDRKYGDTDERLRLPDMRALIDLSTKLPNLEELDSPDPLELFPHAYADDVLKHFQRPWEGPWRDTRHSFAHAAASALRSHAFPSASLRKLRVHFFRAAHACCPAVDQARPLPDLASASPSPDGTGAPRPDPLSAALRHLSTNLVDLDLRVLADASLFWPSAAAAPPPHWPRLRRLRVELHAATPSGAWHFVGPRGEDPGAAFAVARPQHYPPTQRDPADEAWDGVWSYEGGRAENVAPDAFRVRAREEGAAARGAEPVRAVLGAWARALGRMPVVREAEVCWWVGWWPGEERLDGYLEEDGEDGEDEEETYVHRWGVRYAAGEGEEGGKRRVEWQVGEWRPGEEVRGWLKESLGSEVEEVWLPFDVQRG